MTQLVVTSPFGGYGSGARITDAATITSILNSSNRIFVVVVADGGSGGSAVNPLLPNGLVPIIGVPDPSLAVTYGFALDLTSVPNTLYRWSGSAWAIAIQAGSGGTVQPILQVLGLSKLTGVAGTAFSATISGTTAGSTLAATAADGTALTVANGALSGTFGSAGQKQISIVETLAGATGSPKTTTLTLTISATPVLQALGLSSQTAVAGSAFSATISGQTSGSTVVATSSDGTALTVANGQLSGTFAAAGSPTITLAETLAGATGSPKSTQLAVTVSAAAAAGGALDFSDPNNSALIGAL